MTLPLNACLREANEDFFVTGGGFELGSDVWEECAPGMDVFERAANGVDSAPWIENEESSDAAESFRE